jgi:isopentenyl diphosphate isomerase/L-lactate dehydrogenase-like FMN-dependent dehydrogenase
MQAAALQRGTDILKALALGADGVAIGGAVQVE